MNDANGKTILIVDDEPDIREVLSISLRDMGYRTVEAENAATAFDLFQKENPQIVVTDIKMPGGDGIGLLRKIKHENSETEVIMMTSVSVFSCLIFRSSPIPSPPGILMSVTTILGFSF